MMLSLIIPAREEEKQIEATIRQFEDLSIPHEVIISDDGSTDKTVEIAKRFANTVLTYQGDTHVISRARNAGVRASKGDVLVFMDSDSHIPEPNKFFARALEHFEKDSSLVALASPQRVRPELERTGDTFVYGLDNLINRFFNNVLHHGAGAGKCIIVKRDAFEKIKGFREDLIFREDGDLLKRLSKIGRTYMDPQMVAYHSGRRIHRLGIPRFYWLWFINGLYGLLFNHSRVKEWTPIR